MNIEIFIIFTVLFLIFSFFALRSLENLSPQFSSYYDFGRYFPHAGRWIFLIYLAFLVLGIIILLAFAKTNLQISPA